MSKHLISNNIRYLLTTFSFIYLLPRSPAIRPPSFFRLDDSLFLGDLLWSLTHPCVHRFLLTTVPHGTTSELFTNIFTSSPFLYFGSVYSYPWLHPPRTTFNLVSFLPKFFFHIWFTLICFNQISQKLCQVKHLLLTPNLSLRLIDFHVLIDHLLIDLRLCLTRQRWTMRVLLQPRVKSPFSVLFFIPGSRTFIRDSKLFLIQ